jgi:hypothetical protein
MLIEAMQQLLSCRRGLNPLFSRRASAANCCGQRIFGPQRLSWRWITDLTWFLLSIRPEHPAVGRGNNHQFRRRKAGSASGVSQVTIYGPQKYTARTSSCITAARNISSD